MRTSSGSWEFCARISLDWLNSEPSSFCVIGGCGGLMSRAVHCVTEGPLPCNFLFLLTGRHMKYWFHGFVGVK